MLYIVLNLCGITRSGFVLVLVILFKQRVIAIELTFNCVCNFIFKIKSKVKNRISHFILHTPEQFFQPAYVRNRANTNTNCGIISVVLTALLKIFVPEHNLKSIINTLLTLNPYLTP